MFWIKIAYIWLFFQNNIFRPFTGLMVTADSVSRCFRFLLQFIYRTKSRYSQEHIKLINTLDFFTLFGFAGLLVIRLLCGSSGRKRYAQNVKHNSREGREKFNEISKFEMNFLWRKNIFWKHRWQWPTRQLFGKRYFSYRDLFKVKLLKIFCSINLFLRSWFFKIIKRNSN